MAVAASDNSHGPSEDGQDTPQNANGGLAGRSGRSEPNSPASPSTTSAVSDTQLVEKPQSKARYAGPGLESGHYNSNDHESPIQHLYNRFRRWIASSKEGEQDAPRPSLYPIPEVIKSVGYYPPGYGKVAASLDTDPGFLVFRRFGWLHNYALLELQDELQQLEQKLEIHDRNEYTKGNRKRLKARRIDAAQSGSRHDLMVAIHQKLGQYDEMLFRIERVQAMQRPLPRYQRSVCAMVHYENRMLGVEADWITRSDDLATVSRYVEHGWLNGFVEDILYATSTRLLMWFFSNDEQRTRAKGADQLILVSPQRLDGLVRLGLTLGLSLELLVPLLLLYRIQTDSSANTQRIGYIQIGIIFIATLLFSASCAFFTRAKRHEVFEATAAYCAVLVVFLGNTSNVVVASNT